MARRPGMRDVELVEAGGDADPWADGAPAAPDDPTARPRGGPGTQRRRAVRAGLATLLLGTVLAGTTLGAERREQARLAVLADVPGVAAPVEGPVEVRWRLPDSQVATPRWIGERVVVVLRASDGGLDVAGLDPATGVERWRVALSPPGEGSEPYASCDSPAAPAGGHAGDRVLACVVVEETDTVDAVGVGTGTYPTRARLVVVDVATGAVRSDDPVAATTTVVALGPDLVVGWVDDDDHARLARVDPRDRTERWSFRSPDEVPPDRLGGHRVLVTADGELVVLDVGAAWVLTSDGQVRHTWPPDERVDPDGPVTRLLDGRGTVVRTEPDGSGAVTTEVLDVRSGRTWTVPGHPTTVWPDDGSVPDLLLVHRTDGAGATAYDLASGDERWTRRDAPGSGEMLVRGRLLGTDGEVVRAVDARSGRTVWTTAQAGPGRASLVTDGRVVLVSSTSTAGAGSITALDLDDGRERWSVEADPGLFLRSVDGAILGFGVEGAVVLDDRSGGR